ncbi:MAG: hypothetical protein FJZ59_02875 [Chlamydiae bacterium]|nr:hypothetical protein [Chlamydiota bacterium]
MSTTGSISPFYGASPTGHDTPFLATPTASESESDTSSVGSRTSRRGSLASPTASPGPAAGRTSTRPIPMGNITINGSQRGVYLYFVDETGNRIDLPAGVSIPLERLQQCTKIFQELVIQTERDLVDCKNLKSISSEGFSFSGGSTLTTFNDKTFPIWQRFRSLLLTGREQIDAHIDVRFGEGSPRSDRSRSTTSPSPRRRRTRRPSTDTPSLTVSDSDSRGDSSSRSSRDY